MQAVDQFIQTTALNDLFITCNVNEFRFNSITSLFRSLDAQQV